MYARGDIVVVTGVGTKINSSAERDGICIEAGYENKYGVDMRVSAKAMAPLCPDLDGDHEGGEKAVSVSVQLIVADCGGYSASRYGYIDTVFALARRARCMGVMI